MKNKSHILAVLVPVVVFLGFCVLFAWCGMYTFSYQESLGTFFYTSAFVRGTVGEPGGVARLLSLYLTQFFICPYAGVVIMSALLTAISCVLANVIKRISGDWSTAPLALLPSVAIALLNYNVNYYNSGTIALLAAALALWGQVRIGNIQRQLVYAVAATVVLSYGFGAVALLYGVLAVVTALMSSPKSAVVFLACPLMACGLGCLYVRAGWFGDMSHVLTPAAYFTLRLTPGAAVNLPWVLFAAAVLAGCAATVLKKVGKGVKIAIAAVSLVGAVVYASVASTTMIDRQSEQFKQMSYYIGRQQWQKVIDMCSALPMYNLLQQNCLNMALAETGQLADRLFDYPVYDIRSIYIEGEKVPYMQALLSDIYWSMGHVALAQRNAFEANESLDNISPKLIQRLAQTNLALRQYDVAAKYINLLSKTKYYSDEAEHYKTLLNNEAALMADAELGAKSRCIFPDNRFSAYKGLDDDLLQIVRANPQYEKAMQYLGSLYLLSKDIPRFEAVTTEYYGSDSIARPLPKAFAQAMLHRYSNASDSIVSRYNIPADVTEAYRDFKHNSASQPRSFWYFYGYVR